MLTQGEQTFARRLQCSQLLQILLLEVMIAICLGPAFASEFPQRECCDSIPPLPAQFTTAPVPVATGRPEATTSTTVKPTGTHNLHHLAKITGRQFKCQTVKILLTLML